VSKDFRKISIAERIVQYLNVNIIPSNKWHDFEPYFSCSQLSLDTYDHFTGNHLMNTMSIYWCSEGFKELYKITNNIEYLKTGEYILSILSQFQQVWNMPYISINTFGGFGVQNHDAELSDARQALFVPVYMDYYILTGKKEYMERGIAALRASWALQLLKEYKSLCPGNLNGIDTIEGIDKGSVYENYGHTGSDFRTPGHIAFNWGVGTAATATAYVKRNFSDLFIDFQEKSIWGIDGVLVNSYQFTDRYVEINYNKTLNKKIIRIKARCAPKNPVKIILNGVSMGDFEKESFDKGLLLKV
jgi:hypothetical protein